MSLDPQQFPRTVAGALDFARARLGALPSADSDAIELVSRLLGTSRVEMQQDRARPLASRPWDQLEKWLDRRCAGEPVQYITGRAVFLDFDLEVGPAVLVPRPETEGLAEAALVLARAESSWSAPGILDLGTGSGAIAIALARALPEARVVATDRSAAALALAQRNALALGVADRIEFRAGDWFDCLAADERFELILSNPPYLSTLEWDELPEDVRRFEPHEALFSGSSGLDALRDIIDQAPRHLVPGGVLALELSERRAEEVAGWLEGASEFESVTLREDLGGRPRTLWARRARGPAIAPLQWREDAPRS